jgi:hypothetical protein
MLSIIPLLVSGSTVCIDDSRCSLLSGAEWVERCHTDNIPVFAGNSSAEIADALDALDAAEERSTSICLDLSRYSSISAGRCGGAPMSTRG